MAKNQKEDNLVGTLYATFGVGIVMIIIWVSCFMIFTDRM